MSRGVFSLSAPPVRNADMLTAALNEAEMRSRAKGHCAAHAK
jgi:hypothetical protein